MCPSEKLAQDVLEEFHARVEHIRFSWLASMVLSRFKEPCPGDFDLLFHALQSRMMEGLTGYLYFYLFACLFICVCQFCLWLSVPSGLD